jgi:molecular chaperone HscB
MNYFELFGIPVSFNVDSAALSRKYFELQRQYHPDFYTRETSGEKDDALEMSSMINKAFNTLKDEEATIKYILQLEGLLEEDEKYQLPPAFLMEMMELNEALMEGDDSIAGKLDAINKEIYEMVKPVMAAYQKALPDREGLLQVKNYYYQKKYLNRIAGQLNGMS